MMLQIYVGSLRGKTRVMTALNLLGAWGAFCSGDGVNVGQGGGCDRRMSASCCREDKVGMRDCGGEKCFRGIRKVYRKVVLLHLAGRDMVGSVVDRKK